ncbi:Asp-tRNA(Asn)/Glu-tRNA(Gln) amidotransferase GatCAB subunit C [Candidatus Falkowbacteria bacterium CG10_big_fil_rev_8_21_14_0_10_37_14]|uniref:Aspartyl/glutamyl-tRNA(Asn/Gln) amidotransferase subunit C n=1 Tax=Candidatus Falkowbacteria bacterium CG10_big_fil_rev_8_21_14_0_10_37_14 TaxID=1974561 RepID=A0A2M6WUH1_9BACT|nr:Asp-tRNA(Asn)/Glu-tRNA(Gln) amidotransferase subunit GatC [Candidatus Falkowbacteria bacterium]PIT96443.1 MAG: Asp-tRNA(Asn)/Glu-tRNA(Gln) amidotransferase GatCAB subunit C [Candidatus Falkowbacteria bacterium CG10_big_fil_rev_8_21_14_0_10_37_14]
MLNSKKVSQVAELAKLKITDEEATKYAKELGKVLDYIDELNKVDVTGVEPTAQVTGQVNRWRADVAVPWDDDERQTALSSADVDDNGLVRAGKIM